MTVKALKKKNNMPNFKKNTSSAMKRSGFKMKGYTYSGTKPSMAKKVVDHGGERDWRALYNQAKKEGASEEQLANLLAKAQSQKSAQDYVDKNPDAKRVEVYAKGRKTV